MGKSLEVHSTARICRLVAARYKEGPFAWTSLFEHEGASLMCCSQCLNHIRKRRGFRRREMLPMDHFLLTLLNPGYLPRVDRRSARRLWNALGDHVTNRFRHTGIWPLECILSSDYPTQAWWQQNLSTPFFRDKHAARLVRLELER
jgi:hypothetical protein